MAGGNSKDKKAVGILVVGTSSPSRQPLAEKAFGAQYEVTFIHPDIDEKCFRSTDALQLTRRLAEAKMKAVLAKIEADPELVKRLESNSVVYIVTFDQVVVWGNEIREKPYDLREAKKFLRDYSNSTVSTVQATVFFNYHTKQQSFRHNTTRTYYGEISEKVINKVLETGAPLCAAGGFVVENPDLQACMKKIDPGIMEEVQGVCTRAINEMISEFGTVEEKGKK